VKTVRASLVGFGLGVVSFFILGAIWSPGDHPKRLRGEQGALGESRGWSRGHTSLYPPRWPVRLFERL